jgi:hypothetical protein
MFKRTRKILDTATPPNDTDALARLARRSFLVVVGFAVAGGLLNANTACAVECDTLALKQQCCSAKKCGGKVLSNRDAHNCKDTSKGKSWHPASDGQTEAQCTKL